MGGKLTFITAIEIKNQTHHCFGRQYQKYICHTSVGSNITVVAEVAAEAKEAVVAAAVSIVVLVIGAVLAVLTVEVAAAAVPAITIEAVQAATGTAVGTTVSGRANNASRSSCV